MLEKLIADFSKLTNFIGEKSKIYNKYKKYFI